MSFEGASRRGDTAPRASVDNKEVNRQPADLSRKREPSELKRPELPYPEKSLGLEL